MTRRKTAKTRPATRRRKGSGSVTLRDVAKAAGVGTTTVSRVIRNIGPVSEETRKAVEDAIARLGYAPNMLAGSLASVDSHLIGVIIPATRVLVFLDLLHGIQTGLKGTRFKAVIAETGFDLQAEEEAIRGLLGWRPAAMLITGCDHTPAAREMLANYGGRVVEMMDIDHDPVDACVGYSNDEAGRLAVAHLIDRGYRSFAYVGHALGTDHRGRRRFLAMSQHLSDHGLGFVTTHFLPEMSSVTLGRSATEHVRMFHPDVDAIIYANDTLAMGGMFHCMSAGIRMPEDLAIFGFSSIDIAQELPRPLTTIDTQRHEIGLRAVREAIDTPDRPDTPVRIDTGLRLIAGRTA